jgi:hypothetical protein
MAYKMSEKLMCHFPHKYFPSVIWRVVAFFFSSLNLR